MKTRFIAVFSLVAALLMLQGMTVSAQTAPAVNENLYPETWVQYAPIAIDICLPLTGVQSRSNFATRLTKATMAYGIMTAVVRITKDVVEEQRPDGSAWNSFPSGHTATAFTGAELMRQDYGWGWGTAAYASGVYVAAMRVVHERHWWWDTCAGAAVGIGSSLAAQALTPAIVNHIVNPAVKWCASLLGIPASGVVESVSIAPAIDPISGVTTASICIGF